MVAQPPPRIHLTKIMPADIASTKMKTPLRPDAIETTADPGQ